KLITNHIENRLGDLLGVASSASKSIEGLSLVELKLAPDASPALVFGQVNALLASIVADLPTGSSPPLVQLGEPGAGQAIGILAIQSQTVHEYPLTELARRIVRLAVGRLAGVRAPSIVGGMDRRVAVYIDRDKLEARNLTLADVYRALKNHLAG